MQRRIPLQDFPDGRRVLTQQPLSCSRVPLASADLLEDGHGLRSRGSWPLLGREEARGQDHSRGDRLKS